jgi:hypothetical protein
VTVLSAEEPKRSRNSYMLKSGTKAKVSVATVATNSTIHNMARSPGEIQANAPLLDVSQNTTRCAITSLIKG